MKHTLFLFFLCMLILGAKVVITGKNLQLEIKKQELLELQELTLDVSKDVIARLEYYKSASFLNSQKEKLGLVELTPQNTIVVPLSTHVLNKSTESK